MFRLILDQINEYLEEQRKGRWIGNERLTEMEYDLDKLLAKIIDNRIKAKSEENNK